MQNEHQVFIAVGSNLGKRIYNLDFAVRKLKSMSTQPIQCSPVYETDPVGYLEQPNFLNMVIRAYVFHSPQDLLETLMQIEAECGRTRDIHNGPRTLDLDILLYDSNVVANRNLNIPHPRMWERGFVMIPLATLVPHLRGLGGITIKDRARELEAKGDVRYVGRFW